MLQLLQQFGVGFFSTFWMSIINSFPFCCLPAIFQALMSLFVLASKDGWVNIMYHGLDAVGVDQQVHRPNNKSVT